MGGSRSESNFGILHKGIYIHHANKPRTLRSSSSALSDAVHVLPLATNNASGLMSEPIPRQPARIASSTTVPPPRKGSEVKKGKAARRRSGHKMSHAIYLRQS